MQTDNEDLNLYLLNQEAGLQPRLRHLLICYVYAPAVFIFVLNIFYGLIQFLFSLDRFILDVFTSPISFISGALIGGVVIFVQGWFPCVQTRLTITGVQDIFVRSNNSPEALRYLHTVIAEGRPMLIKDARIAARLINETRRLKASKSEHNATIKTINEASGNIVEVKNPQR